MKTGGGTRGGRCVFFWGRGRRECPNQVMVPWYVQLGIATRVPDANPWQCQKFEDRHDRISAPIGKRIIGPEVLVCDQSAGGKRNACLEAR